MSDEERPEQHPADKILGADWKQPLVVEQEKAWARLDPSERERLDQLQRERDKDGNPVWLHSLEPDPDDPEFVLWILKPVDPVDPRPNERVGRWLVKAMTVPLERAQAIIEEHRSDE
jgi:hypothetical protein